MISDKKPIRFITLMIHLLVWLMMFLSPFLFMPNDIDDKWVAFYGHFCQSQAIIIFIFYINYLYLINKFLFREKIWQFLFWNVLIILFWAVALYFNDYVFFPLPKEKFRGPPGLPFEWLFHISRNVILYFLTAALSVAIKMTMRWYKQGQEKKELERSHTEAELKNLKSQLNPHFLFNTLNNIYSLVGISPEKAQDAIHQLSKLLRYVLYDNNTEEVPISQEIEFIENYLDLVRLRFSSKVKINFNILGTSQEVRIAPLLFISLVENAFKHGISTKSESFVNILLDLSTPGEVRFEVLNSYFPRGDEDKSGSGIGLENLRKRLSLMYDGRYEFIAKREGDIYISSVKIHF
ncbi:MAG: histidine kinase [Bacteroidales bacterium]